MAELNLSSPLLQNMDVLEQLSDHEGVCAYVLKNRINEQLYILKYISLPASPTQVDGLRYSGAVGSDEEAQAYYAQVAEDYRNELELLKKLSEYTNIDAFPAYRIEPKEDAIGFDVYLISEYRETLEKYLEKSSMSHRMALELAMDLCGALADLRKAGLLHCNVKPSNICLNSQGHFMLSDMGLFRLSQLKYASVPARMIGDYSAPELFDVLAPMNETLDLYSVGLILYRIYNGGHNPFEDEDTSAQAATDQRLVGKPLPAPIYADYEMAEIILKACAFQAEDRYQTPEELRAALQTYVENNAVDDSPIVPPIVVQDAPLSEEALNETVEPVQQFRSEDMPEEFVQHMAPDTDALADAVSMQEKEPAEAPAEESAMTEAEAPAEESAAPEAEAPVPIEEKAPEQPKKKNKKKKAKQQPAPEAVPPIEAAEAPVEEAPPDTEEPQAQAEIIAEAAVEKPKKKAPWWVWLVVAFVILAGAAAAAYFTLIPKVDAVQVREQGVDHFTLTVTGAEASSISAVSTDTYGNTIVGVSQDRDILFTGLTPGTQYSVKLETLFGYPVRGENALSVTTDTSTEILFFTAKPISETQVELNFNCNGQEPTQWSVEIVPLRVESPATEQVFTGHSVVIPDLSANVEYRFTLKASDQQLTGCTELTYDTTVKTTIGDVFASYDRDKKEMTLRWNYTGEPPAQWTVTCHGADGYEKNKTTETTEVLFNELADDAVYTVEIYCTGMVKAAEKIVRTADATAKNLASTVNEDGTITVTWESEAPIEDGWCITCVPADGGAAVTTETTETTVTLKNLLPKTAYKLKLSTASGTQVNGTGTLEFETPKAVKFKSYGCTSVYTGIFLRPGKENFTGRDLAVSRDTFAPNEGIAFAVQALSSLSASEDIVDIAIVARDKQDKIIDLTTLQKPWNEMWSNKLFVGSLKNTPQDRGTYTLEVYFNGQLVDSKSFTIQ